VSRQYIMAYHPPAPTPSGGRDHHQYAYTERLYIAYLRTNDQAELA